MKIPTSGAVVSIGEMPGGLPGRLGFDSFPHARFTQLKSAIGAYDQVVFIGAYPIVVRALADVLRSKYTDPAVVAVDEGLRYVTALAGSHRGGDDLAKLVASFLGTAPILTTASDLRGKLALDRLPGVSFGEVTPSLQTRINEGAPINLINPNQVVLPDYVTDTLSPTTPGTGSPQESINVVISDRVLDSRLGDARGCLPTLIAGIGASSDATLAEVKELLDEVLELHGLDPRAVSLLATIDSRADHPAIRGIDLPVISYPASKLASVRVPNPSGAVLEAVGTPSVAEAACILAGGTGVELVAAKASSKRATVALARRRQVRGLLSVVGAGPGAIDLITPRAQGRIRSAQYIIGFSGYIGLIEPLLNPNQIVLDYPIGAETERALRALELASRGNRVLLATSGDPAVYAMAQLTCELIEAAPAGLYLGRESLEFEVVPGVTAAYAASARRGAMVGHDHAMISLSDLMTPWATIENRIEAAAKGDFVISLYNPRSKQRSWQLEKALAIISSYRVPETPVLVATRVERDGEETLLTTLGEIDPETVGMETLVMVGSTSTRASGNLVFTPRGYL